MQIPIFSRWLSTKINHKHCVRLFSYKGETRSLTLINQQHHHRPEEVTAVAPLDVSAVPRRVKVEVPKPKLRYNMFSPRARSVDARPSLSDKAQKIYVKAAIEEQHLQPARLPSYYQTDGTQRAS